MDRDPSNVLRPILQPEVARCQLPRIAFSTSGSTGIFFGMDRREREEAQSFGERLRQAMLANGHHAKRKAKSGVDVDALAKVANVTREMARRWAEGKALPQPDKGRVIATWLSVRFPWLQYGEGDPLTHIGRAQFGDAAKFTISSSDIDIAGKPIIEWETPEDLPEGQYVLVPRVSVRVSAGTGVVVYEEEPTGYLAFTTRWIKREHLSRRNLVVVEAVGDSMEPRIREGDILLVDRSQREVRDGKVYALRYGDQLRVKRLFRRYDGALILRSDNREFYPEEAVPPDALDDQVEIIGRVVWVGGGM